MIITALMYRTERGPRLTTGQMSIVTWLLLNVTPVPPTATAVAQQNESDGQIYNETL